MKLLKTKYNMLYTRNQSVQRCKYFPPRVIKTSQLMMYKAKVAVCSEIRKKTLNANPAPRRIFQC